MTDNVQNLNASVHGNLSSALTCLEGAVLCLEMVMSPTAHDKYWSQHPLLRDAREHLTLTIANIKVARRQLETGEPTREALKD